MKEISGMEKDFGTANLVIFEERYQIFLPIVDNADGGIFHIERSEKTRVERPF